MSFLSECAQYGPVYKLAYASGTPDILNVLQGANFWKHREAAVARFVNPVDMIAPTASSVKLWSRGADRSDPVELPC